MFIIYDSGLGGEEVVCDSGVTVAPARLRSKIDDNL